MFLTKPHLEHPPIPRALTNILNALLNPPCSRTHGKHNWDPLIEKQPHRATPQGTFKYLLVPSVTWIKLDECNQYECRSPPGLQSRRRWRRQKQGSIHLTSWLTLVRHNISGMKLISRCYDWRWDQTFFKMSLFDPQQKPKCGLQQTVGLVCWITILETTI